MEWVRATRHTSGDGQLDGGVRRKVVDAAGRQEVVRVERSVQDLQQHRDSRRDKRRIVDEELRSVLLNSQQTDYWISGALRTKVRLRFKAWSTPPLKGRPGYDTVQSDNSSTVGDCVYNLLHVGQ